MSVARLNIIYVHSFIYKYLKFTGKLKISLKKNNHEKCVSQFWH